MSLEPSLSTVQGTSGVPQHRLRALLHLAALVLTVPLLLLYALHQLLLRREDVTGIPSPVKDGRRRTVLVTGAKMAKALHAARALWRAGHRVVLVETDKYWCSGSRLSRAVTAFATVTCPRVDGKAYLSDLQRVFDAHGCDTFLPVSSPFSAQYDAIFLRSITEEARFGSWRGGMGALETKDVPPSKSSITLPRNLHFRPAICDILDDKHAFSDFCSDYLGLTEQMLPSHRLTSDPQVLELNKEMLRRDDGTKFVIKNLAYDPLHRLDLFCLPQANEADVVAYLKKIRDDGNGICEQEPWQAQLFVECGTEIACYAVVRESRLRLFTACLSSASQLRYVHTGGRAPEGVSRNVAHTALVDKQTAACRAWLENFCAAAAAKGETLSGQLCLDFMCNTPVDEEGVRAFPLECNPRVHSMCCVFTSADQCTYGQVLVDTACEDVVESNEAVEPVRGGTSDKIVFEPSPSARAEQQFIGWWANEFYSNKYNPLVMVLEVLYSILYFLLSGGKTASCRAFRYCAKEGEDANAAWYSQHFGFRDADFDASDPLPFLGRNLLQPLVLMWGVLRRGNEWKKYDYCIGKVVEKNGD